MIDFFTNESISVVEKKSFLLFHRKLKMLIIKIFSPLQKSKEQFFHHFEIINYCKQKCFFLQKNNLRSITVFQFYT